MMLNEQYQKSIEACMDCASACNHCAASCLEEKEVQSLTKCIRLDLECAVICQVTAELMSQGSRYTGEICELCATICNACAEECEKHADRDTTHCKECAETCKACAKEATEVYQNLKEQHQDKKAMISVRQEECAAISRAAATLMSLESAYSQQVCQLNVAICNAAAEELEKYLNREIKHAREYALISNEAHQHLKTQDQEMKKADAAVPKNNEQSVQQKENIEKKKKHSSALLAASLWRSPVSHIRPHIREERIYNPFWSRFP